MKAPVLLLHRKSANRPEVKEAVKAVQREGIKLKVRIPWNKKDKQVLVRELVKRGCQRIIAGGGGGGGYRDRDDRGGYYSIYFVDVEALGLDDDAP